MAGAGVDVGTSVNASAKTTVEVSIDARTLVNTVLRLSCNVQAAVVDSLVAAGHLIDVCSAEDGEYSDIESDSEEFDFDAECEESDDDEVFADIVAKERAADVDYPDEVVAFVGDRMYEIKIVKRGARYVCVPPRNPFAALRARNSSNIAMGQLLGAFRGQFDAFRKIARYVETSYADALGDAETFLAKEPLSNQAEFAKTNGIEAPQLSVYVRACRLSWPGVSVPASRIFAKF